MSQPHIGSAAWPGYDCRSEARRARLTVSPVAGGGDALARVQRENETLYAVIKTVSSSLDLDRVLGWSVDEGLTGWVARTKTPEFIRDNAMADPRMKYVPLLEEEHFQSMVAVPVLAPDGDV